jgi:hypothetical protein
MSARMTDKISRYRNLAKSLAEIGYKHASEIRTQRYRLMYRYFVRCSRLSFATVLLVENGFFSAAYALQKSIVDGMLNGLYIGYVAKDVELDRLIKLALKGRATGYSGMGKRARQIDAELRKRSRFTTEMHIIVRNTQELLNEFGHGGLLSTVMEAEMPPEVGYKVLADSVLTLLCFLGNVYIVENIDLAPIQQLMREFDQTGKPGQ